MLFRSVYEDSDTSAVLEMINIQRKVSDVSSSHEGISMAFEVFDNGNSGVRPAGEFIFRHDDDYGEAVNEYATKFLLNLHDTSGTQQTRFLIDADGNAAIGTVNPTQKLHLYNGDFMISSDSGIPAFHLELDSDGGGQETAHISYHYDKIGRAHV